MTVKTFFSLLLIAATSPSVACQSTLDNAGISPLNSKQANGALNRTLLSLDNSDSASASDIIDIDCYLQKQAELFPLLKDFNVSLRTLGDRLANADTKEAKRSVVQELKRTVARDAGTGYVQFPGAEESGVSINLFTQLIGNYCNKQTNKICGEATDLAKKLWLIAGKYRSLADTLNKEDKLASREFNRQLDLKWRSYRDDTIKLWPQEVLINSLVYQPSSVGLSTPPSFKLMALRPELGLSYLSDQSHYVQPTINLNLLGVYWWQYDGTKASAGRGLSASLIWDGDDTAYGLTYHHTPKWSATLAQGNENDLVVSISFQLAYWLL